MLPRDDNPKVVGYRLPTVLADRIQQKAAADRRTISTTVQLLLEEALAAHPKPRKERTHG